MQKNDLFACPICGGRRELPVFEYNSPPDGEVRFRFIDAGVYHRVVVRCSFCGHYVSRHSMDDSALYTGEYVNATYKDADGIRRTFEKIVNLAPGKSDNAGRVRRINEVMSEYRSGAGRMTVLDVGSGLCVFLHGMKQSGWDCTALDPDPRAAKHAEEYVGVKSICGDFMGVDAIGSYDLVTFNKVLEHVVDPVRMLVRAEKFLKKSGMVYIEVPDGESAEAAGPGREEFFIDHLHVFSLLSLVMMCRQVGYKPVVVERLQEPSTKFTLRLFMVR